MLLVLQILILELLFKLQHFQCVKNYRFKAMYSWHLIAIYLQNTNATFCKWEAFTSGYHKFNHKNMYEMLSELASFCKRYDKTFRCVFRFTVSSAVYLQNASVKFHKVV